jgi:hypothetical protein
MATLKHTTAVRHLRQLTEALDDELRLARALEAETTVVAAYAFGEVLAGVDRLDRNAVALVVNRPARDLPWGTEPPEVRDLFARQRLERLPLGWFCRPADLPAANHRIVRPVRIWSLEGPDEEALEAIAAGQAEALRPAAPDPEALTRQLEEEAALVLAALDDLVHGFRGDPQTIAEEVYELAWGYTDLRRGLAELRGEQPAASPAPATEPAWTFERYVALANAVRDRDGERVVAIVGDAPLDEVAQLAGEGLLVALAQRAPGAAEAAERCGRALSERDWWGDEELVDELAAALDRGPSPARRSVTVDLGELGSHLEGTEDPLNPAMRLQLATGTLLPDFEDWEAMTGEPPPDDWDAPDAWLPVEPQGSREGYRDMEVFAGTVADRRLADRLDRALVGRGAFRRFREVLADHTDEHDRWRVISSERVRGRARSWLADHGYRPA